jgi:hypothetical protein
VEEPEIMSEEEREFVSEEEPEIVSEEEPEIVSEEEPEIVSEEEPEIVSEEEQEFSDGCAKILKATELLAGKLNFEFAEKGSEEWKAQQFAISFGLLQPTPKYSDEELINAAIASFYQQFLFLQGEYKDYCAVVGTLFLVIFRSRNPDNLKMHARLLTHLEKDQRFGLYVRFVMESIFNPIVKERVAEIMLFWTKTLGTGVFGLSQPGFNYNNMHRAAEQISDMPRDGSHVTDLFLGFFLQWLPNRQKGLDYSASRWHKGAEESFGYAATLLFNGMK